MNEPIDDVWIDANGVPTERIRRGGQEVIVHYDDLPDKDITVLHGIPVTTALRTVIDMAPELSTDELVSMVRDFLDRRLFSVDEAVARIHEPDMLTRAGALLLSECLAGLGYRAER